MSISVLDMSMSLDGYIAGPNDGPDNPGGDGFVRLHEWALTPDGTFRQSGPAGELLGESNAAGAVVAGRRTAEQVDHWGGVHHGTGVPVLLGYDRERRWIRHVHSDPQWRTMFPYLPNQSGYHKRLKNAEPLLRKTIITLAVCCPSWFDGLWMTDAIPVPWGMSRETVKRSDLAGYAGYGYRASHSRFYWGLKLSLICTGEGMPVSWCLANPKIGEREALAALLDHDHHLIRTGQLLVADKGFSGKPFKQLTTEMGLELLRPDRKDETYRNGNLGGVRQWIESVNQTLKGQLGLEHHSGRTPAGVSTRVTQRLLAMAASRNQPSERVRRPVGTGGPFGSTGRVR